MADLHGGDIQEMTRLADSVDRSADSVDALAATAQAGVAESARIWIGGDADWFRSNWSSVHDPMMRQAAIALRAMAQQIRINRDHQAATSAADLGPGSGGGGTAGPGPWTPGPFRPGPGGPGGPYPWYPDNQPGGPGNIGSAPAGRFWYDAFSFGERDDGRLVEEYTTDWAFGAAAAGSYYYRQLPGGGFELVADIDARSGLQGQIGGTHDGEFLGVDLEAQGEVGAFLGGRGSGSAAFELSDDGYLIDVGGEAFVGAEAYANGDVTYGVVGATGSAFAMAGAGASGNYMQEFDGRNVRTSVSADAFYGAKAGVEGDIALGDDVSLGGGVGVSTGIGAGFEGGFALGLDEVGVELDLGLALGLGFDASIDVSFDPVGLGGDIVDGGGAVLDAGKDATGWISPWW